MFKHTLRDSSHIGPVRSMIGLPVLLISVFCFGFIIIQSHTTASLQPTADSRPVAPSTHNQLPIASPAPFAPSSLAAPAPTTPVATTPSTSGPLASTAPSASANVDTGKVQPSAASTSLQAAKQNNQSSGKSKKTGKQKLQVTLPGGLGNINL